MGMRHAAVMAGLALGLMSGAAEAATYTYDVNFGQGSGNGFGPIVSSMVTGTITTNSDSGVLSNGNITGFDLTTSVTNSSGTFTESYDSSNGVSNIGGNALSAVGQNLVFTFLGNGSGVQLYSDTLSGRFTLDAGDSSRAPNVGIEAQGNQDLEQYGVGLSIVIATDRSISTVPLPASAPMFGAALVALGAAGYGLKRKSKAAAQA